MDRTNASCCLNKGWGSYLCLARKVYPPAVSHIPMSGIGPGICATNIRSYGPRDSLGTSCVGCNWTRLLLITADLGQMLLGGLLATVRPQPVGV